MKYVIIGFCCSLGVVSFAVVILVGLVIVMEFNKWRKKGR